MRIDWKAYRIWRECGGRMTLSELQAVLTLYLAEHPEHGALSVWRPDDDGATEVEVYGELDLREATELGAMEIPRRVVMR